jgi:hypothetical protein
MIRSPTDVTDNGEDGLDRAAADAINLDTGPIRCRR